MKIFICSDIIIDYAQKGDNYSTSEKVINTIIASSECSLWIASITIAKVLDLLHHGDKNLTEEFQQFIIKSATVIPLRKSDFFADATALKSGNENSLQYASAKSLGMDCMITDNVNDFPGISIPVLTPKQFLQNIAADLSPSAQIPFMDLSAQHHLVYNEIDDRFTEIIRDTGFILGKHVEEFENGFAALQEAQFCIGLSSGTDALHIALLAHGIGHGDKVIVPVNTFIATAEAVSLCGATPVFVDHDEYYNIDCKKVRELLARDTSKEIAAIIPVHLYGQPADLNELTSITKEFGLHMIEDCCQSHLAAWHGKRTGNFGSFGAFSFYPGKNLGAYGEAGALTTNSKDLFEKALMIRQHGAIKQYHHNVIGHNYRMEAMQGAVLATKLKHLADWSAQRLRNARLYSEQLSGLDEIVLPAERPGASCVYHLYVIQTEKRDELQQFLKENNIITGQHYPIPLHLQKAYADLGYTIGDFPAAEKGAKRILSLPMFPELSFGQIQRVCGTIKKYFKVAE